MRGLSDFTPPAAAVEYWPSFVDAVQLVNGKSAGWPAELDLVCRWYAPHLERIHEDACRSLKSNQCPAVCSRLRVLAMLCTWLCIGTACAGVFAGCLVVLLAARLP